MSDLTIKPRSIGANCSRLSCLVTTTGNHEGFLRVTKRTFTHTVQTRRKPPSLARRRPSRAAMLRGARDRRGRASPRFRDPPGMTEILTFTSGTSSLNPTFRSVVEKFRETFHSTYRRGKARRTALRLRRSPHLFRRLRSSPRFLDAESSPDTSGWNGVKGGKLCLVLGDRSQTPAMARISPPERNEPSTVSLCVLRVLDRNPRKPRTVTDTVPLQTPFTRAATLTSESSETEARSVHGVLAGL